MDMEIKLCLSGCGQCGSEDNDNNGNDYLEMIYWLQARMALVSMMTSDSLMTLQTMFEWLRATMAMMVTGKDGYGVNDDIRQFDDITNNVWVVTGNNGNDGYGQWGRWAVKEGARCLNHEVSAANTVMNCFNPKHLKCGVCSVWETAFKTWNQRMFRDFEGFGIKW